MSKKTGKKQKDAPAGVPDGISVAGHPRSSQIVRRAKGWGGFAGAVLCTLLALSANVPLFDALLRGLAGGVAAYIVTWALALAVARQLVIAEVRARYAEVMAAQDASASDGS
ncbi:MAG: hypothetical protein QOJ85_2981 [Solirubrobacteraceae bacterium]|jgi:hypothetical protein|nr:hypothetical protein [Solirubrobacteraceae bacterium]MEA2242929.1 hypothetical protein [Solirubrobacteraceae bacterium]